MILPFVSSQITNKENIVPSSPKTKASLAVLLAEASPAVQETKASPAVSSSRSFPQPAIGGVLSGIKPFAEVRTRQSGVRVQ